MFRTYKYRLYPTADQAEKLAEFSRVVRFVYNLALEQRRDFWRQYKRATGKTLSYATQCLQLTELRRGNDWIEAVPSSLQQCALRDLDKAFSAFFAGGGFPRFRKAALHEGFAIKAGETGIRPLNGKYSKIKIPKMGWVKFRDTRPVSGEIRTVRVVLEGGKWFACIGVRSNHEAPQGNLPSLGIDRGITLALATSEGEVYLAPGHLQNLDRVAREAQRGLSRKKRGSNRYRKQRRVIADQKAKAARIRRDWQHKTTTQICRDYSAVVIEDLKVSRMTRRARDKGVAQKRGLNRSILNIGWHSIEIMLAYKLEERGGTLIKINPAYTSQTCSACGTIDKHSRESQARFACTSCGHTMNADHNAAINILRQGLPVVDERGCASVEARTTQPRLAA